MAKQAKAKVAAKEEVITFPPTKDGEYCRPGYNSCGFSVRGGRYYLAPNRVRTAADIASEKQGVRDMLDGASKLSQEMFARVNGMSTAWWDSVLNDIGVKEGRSRWIYRLDGDGAGYLEQQAQGRSCAYCDWAVDSDPDEALLREHFRSCDKHPLAIRVRELEAELAAEREKGKS